MARSVVLMRSPNISTRDRNATCATCGRRGTWAVIVYGEDRSTIERYCRRCWPRAQSVSDQRVVDEMDRLHAEWLAWASRRMTQPTAPEPSLDPPGTRFMAWHWSLAAGTLWRSYRQMRHRTAQLRNRAAAI